MGEILHYNKPTEQYVPDERIKALFREVSEPLKGKFAHQITDYQLTPEQRHQIATARSGYDTRGGEGRLGTRWLPASEALLRLKHTLPPSTRLNSTVFMLDLTEEIADMIQGYYARHKVYRTIEAIKAIRVFENLGILDRGH